MHINDTQMKQWAEQAIGEGKDAKSFLEKNARHLDDNERRWAEMRLNEQIGKMKQAQTQGRAA